MTNPPEPDLITRRKNEYNNSRIIPGEIHQRNACLWLRSGRCRNPVCLYSTLSPARKTTSDYYINVILGVVLPPRSPDGAKHIFFLVPTLYVECTRKLNNGQKPLQNYRTATTALCYFNSIALDSDIHASSYRRNTARFPPLFS